MFKQESDSRRHSQGVEMKREHQSNVCPHGDTLCPCPDGDPCHYEGENPMTCPKVLGERERAAQVADEYDSAVASDGKCAALIAAAIRKGKP